MPKEVADRIGAETQGPDAVARSVAILMADSSRQGQLIYSWGGRFKEIEEAKLLPLGEVIVGQSDDEVIKKLHEEGSNVGKE